MPKILPIAVIQAKNELNANDPWLVFLQVVLPNSGGTLYLVNNTENVTWNGQVYTALPFQLGVTKYTDTSEISAVDLKITNVNRIIQPYIDSLNGAIGAEITMTIVNAGLLAEDHSELEIVFQVISTTVDAEWVTFNLGAPNPIIQRFPLYKFIANHCNWVANYKGIECAYAGALPTCNGTLEDCEAHSNSHRFGGFKGLNPNAFRLV